MDTIRQKTAQQIVDTVKSVCGFDINFIGEDGIVLASTDPDRIGSFHEAGRQAGIQPPVCTKRTTNFIR